MWVIYVGRGCNFDGVILTQFTLRERFLDDECYVVSMKTHYDSGLGPITKRAIMKHNMITRIPSVHLENEEVKFAFEEFKLSLARIHKKHISDFEQRFQGRFDVR